MWDAFWTLNGTRNGNGWVANRLTLPEIEAYGRMMQIGMAGWEIDALLAMDAAWFGAQRPMGEAPKVSERKLTPALFEALF